MKLINTILLTTSFLLISNETALAEENNKKLDAPLIQQLPELPRGCEVTSLAMMLNFAGVEVDKLTLGQEIKRVPFEENGLKGNPYDGFVGDMYSFETSGYGVYNEPIAELAEKYLPGEIENLTGQEAQEIYKKIDEGKPVWVITNSWFSNLPERQFETWKTTSGDVQITYREHSVLVTGYDNDYVYVNDPLFPTKNRKIGRKNFEDSWYQMGQQAISYQKKEENDRFNIKRNSINFGNFYVR